MTVCCRKRLNFASTGYAFLFSPAMSLGGAAVEASIGCRCNPVELPKIAHEVCIRAQVDLFKYLLDGEKGRAQEFRRPAQSNFL